MPSADLAGLSPADAAFWAEIEGARIIYVSEVHDNEMHHRQQEVILQGLFARGKQVVLGMEMFEIDQQQLLNDWQAGGISIDSLFAAVNWQKSWGVYSPAYRRIMEWSVARDIRIYALNAPRSEVRKLMEGDKKVIARLRFDALEGGFDFFKSQMVHHPGMRAGGIERYYNVQQLWEQTMAETIVKLAKKNPKKVVVVMIGRGHTDARFGVPAYVAQKIRATQVVVDPTLKNPQSLLANTSAF